MNGYEATRAIRAMDIPGISDVPIIALSANAFESDIKEALEAGMDAHVAKPLNVPTLMGKLAELLQKRTVDSGRAEKPAQEENAHTENAKTEDKGLIASLSDMGCDVETTLRTTFMGNEAFYLKMFGKLAASTAIGRMRTAVDGGSAAALFEASHELKGVYASLGLTPLHALCSEIVEIARPKKGIDGADERLRRLEKLHGEVLALATSGAKPA